MGGKLGVEPLNPKFKDFTSEIEGYNLKVSQTKNLILNEMVKRKFSGTIIINKTPEEIFKFMSNPYNIPLWLKASSVKVLSDQNLGVGTKYAEIYSSGNKTYEIESEITEHVPCTKWSYKTSVKAFSLTVTYTLTPMDGGVKVEGIGEMDLGLMSFSLPAHTIIVPIVYGRLKNTLKNLKNVLES
ncbi:MAG: SRPBCC family protein [Patescibacteria group bacterium]